MKEFKGTAGPWVVVDDEYSANNTDSSVTIQSLELGVTVAVVGPDYEAPSYSQDIINANLIAAAPDLLSAVNLILELQLRGFITLGDKHNGTLSSAVAKALGESK